MDYDVTTWVGHGVSFGTLLGVLTGIFTPLATAVTVAWFGLQIYESKTVQFWVKRRRACKIARLKAKLDILSRFNQES